MTETHGRSIVKAITWRITGTGTTLAISYVLTGDFKMAGSIAAIQLVSNTFLYYIHERIWNRTRLGQKQ